MTELGIVILVNVVLFVPEFLKAFVPIVVIVGVPANVTDSRLTEDSRKPSGRDCNV